MMAMAVKADHRIMDVMADHDHGYHGALTCDREDHPLHPEAARVHLGLDLVIPSAASELGNVDHGRLVDDGRGGA